MTDVVHIEFINNLPHWIKYGIPAALVVWGAAGCNILFQPDGRIYKVLAMIANYSYSIYLTHYITIRFMQLLLRVFTQQSILLGRGIRFFLIFLVCICGGIIAGKVVETSCNKIFSKLLFGEKRGNK